MSSLSICEPQQTNKTLQLQVEVVPASKDKKASVLKLYPICTGIAVLNSSKLFVYCYWHGFAVQVRSFEPFTQLSISNMLLTRPDQCDV
jgi:hypothetical protein